MDQGAVLDQSIERGWVSVFPLKGQPGGASHVNGNSTKPTVEQFNAAVLRQSAPELFTIQARIKACVARLQTVKGRTISLSLLDAWVEQLSPSDPTLLAAAFNRVEREIPAFPDVAHVVQILERAEFDAAFAVVLRGIPRHTVEWKDRNAYQDPGTWDMHSEAALKLGDRIFVPGKMHEAEPAPVIHPRWSKRWACSAPTGIFTAGSDGLPGITVFLGRRHNVQVGGSWQDRRPD